MTTKNPHAVALGRRTSARKKITSKANGLNSGGRPPRGISRVLWRQVVARAREEGLTMEQLYERLFRGFVTINNKCWNCGATLSVSFLVGKGFGYLNDERFACTECRAEQHLLTPGPMMGVESIKSKSENSEG